MSKLTIATRLADTLGTTTDEAMQFVDDIGAQAADKVAVNVGDDAGAASSGISNWWKAAGATGAAGGGALAWRQQDVNRAEAMASGQQSYQDAMRSIIQSDLPSELKAEMAKSATNANGGGGGGGGGGNPLGFLSGLLESPQTLIALVIVLVVVMNASGGD